MAAGRYYLDYDITGHAGSQVNAHIVMDNGVYCSTPIVPVPSHGTVDCGWLNGGPRMQLLGISDGGSVTFSLDWRAH
jgi:hypothetical protein